MTDYNIQFNYELTALSEDAQIVVSIDGEAIDSLSLSSTSGTYSFSSDYFSSDIENFSISYVSANGTEELTISNFTMNGEALNSSDFSAGQGAIDNSDGSYSINSSEKITWKSAASSNLYISNESQIITPSEAAEISGGSGNDMIHGTNEDDLMNGYAGNDTLQGYLGNDTILGGEGDDIILGDEGNDTLNGNNGADFIRGGAGNDFLYGDAGNDDLRGDTGNDYIEGGDGDDYITVIDGTNILKGGAGNDIIRGGTGNDTAYGGDDNDDIRTGDGNDIIHAGAGDDYIHAGDGDDTIYAGLGVKIINGGNGIDTVNYSAALNGIQINIDRGADFDGDGNIDDKLVFIENAYATNFDDMIFSYDGHNGTFYGLDGNDFFRGGTGIDTVYGGNGNDDIRTEGGNDIIDAGAGDDYVLGGDGMDNISGGSGKDQMRGGLGNDTMYGGDDNDRLYGDEGSDILYGGNGSDLINGGDGNDQIYGGEGDDRLVGMDGNDIIYGGAGNDLIRGLGGMDTLYGGDGDDTFVFTLNDLTDTFHGGLGTDTLIVSGGDTSTIDLTTMTVTGLEIVSLINYGGTNEVANQLIFNAGDVANITNTGTFMVMADAGDTITASQLDATFFVETVDIDGTNYDRYTKNGTDFYFTSVATIELDDAIIANDDLFSVDEEATLNFTFADLLSNDTNLTDATQPLQIINIGSATNGTLVINGTDISYTGDLDYYGTETITYTIQDENGDTITGDIIITVNNINDAPIAKNDEFNAATDTELTGNLFDDNGNGIDYDPDGDAFTFANTGTFATADGGSITLNADGSFSYTSALGYTGTDSYSYTIDDGNGGTATAVVNFDVNASIEPIENIIYDILNPTEVPNDPEIGENGPYEEITFGALFTTSDDVTTRQVIYEQGGANRGFNLYIDNGKLFYSAWSLSSSYVWGYKQVSVDIDPNQTYTASYSMIGTADNNGTFTGFLNGETIGQETGVGFMSTHGYAHGVGISSTTNYGSGSDKTFNPFSGSITKILLARDGLDPNRLDEFEEIVSGDFIMPVLILNDPESTDIVTDARVDNTGPYEKKTLAARFTAGDDVNSTQVIFEQGDTSRGMNIFIDNGEVFIAAWNYNEQNWGYREFSAGISANETATISLVLDGDLPANGILKAYMNGQLLGEFNNVGYLYSHTGSIGIEEKSGGTVIHDVASIGDGLAFDGELEKIVEYNDAISTDLMSQIDAYLVGLKNSPIIDITENNTSVLGGTAGDDTLTGSSNMDVAYGGDGNDTINTYNGNDAIFGGRGNDTINAGNGHDILYGHDGDDYLRSDAGNNQFYGGTGADTIRGGTSADIAYGGTGNDDIRTGDGGDYIYGEDGDDYIESGNHNDVVFGGAGNDIIKGGAGVDKLIGGAGTDRLYGDAGNDIFAFSSDEDSFDYIYTFNMAEDVINITDLLTGYSYADLTDFVQIAHIGSRFDIQVDRDGSANGSNFQTVARVLTDIDNSLTAQDLIDSNAIIANQSIVI